MLAILGGIDYNNTQVNEDADKMIKLEVELAKIMVPPVDARDETKYYHIMKLSALKQMFDWVSILHIFFHF